MTTGTNNITDLPRAEDTAPTWKVNLPYLVLILIMAGQTVAAIHILAGQFVYLAANGIAIYHVFTLDRPTADKVKNICCLGLTLTIVFFKILL